MSLSGQRIRKLAVGGVLASLVLLTTYLIRIPVPATGGYVHPGDGIIFLAAAILGPYAAVAGGLGSALADLLGGYFVYILPTFLIKATMGWLAGWLLRPDAPLRNTLAFTLAACVMVVGYFVFESFLYGWAAALGAVLPNMLQGLAGVVLGIALSMAVARKPLL